MERNLVIGLMVELKRREKVTDFSIGNHEHLNVYGADYLA